MGVLFLLNENGILEVIIYVTGPNNAPIIMLRFNKYVLSLDKIQWIKV